MNICTLLNMWRVRKAQGKYRLLPPRQKEVGTQHYHSHKKTAEKTENQQLSLDPLELRS